MKKTLIFLLLIVLTVSIFAQNNNENTSESTNIIAQNAVYVETGFMVFDFPVIINYERMLKKWGRSHLAAQGAIGVLPNYEYPFAKAGIKFLTGPKKHHLDTGIGILFDFEGDIVLPSVDLGYRFQAPEGKLLFKVGTGFPHLLSFGAGWAF